MKQQKQGMGCLGEEEIKIQPEISKTQVCIEPIGKTV